MADPANESELSNSELFGQIDTENNEDGNEVLNEELSVANSNERSIQFNLTNDESNVQEDPDETDIEGSIGSSIQVASTITSAELEDDFDPNLIIELGDRVIIRSTKHAQTIGMVYYRDHDLIRIKPAGSNTLVDFEVEETDEGEKFKDSESITFSGVIEKRVVFSFVEQQDFRVQQEIDTYSSGGEFYQSYTITEVNESDDIMTIEDQAGDTLELDFNYMGIPQDNPFAVIFIKGFAEKKKEDQPEVFIEEEDLEDDVAAESNEDAVEFIGFVEITLPKVYKEAASYEQRIPDHLQKVDAMNDFIAGLDPANQKNPKAIRDIRILVETLYQLKQATISYRADGSIEGSKPVSAETLADLIQRVPVPLGRPILDIVKKEYYVNPDEENAPVDDDGIEFLDFGEELIQMKQNDSELVSSLVAAGSKKGSILALWSNQQSFFSKYGSPWIANEKTEPLWKAMADTDFFRSVPPNMEEESSLLGYLPSHKEDVAPTFSEVPFGIERALSTTYRKGKERDKQVLLSEDEASIHSYLIFPIYTASQLGSTRSRLLAVDSGRSQMPPKTMKMIFDELGQPKEIGMSSDDIILLNVMGNTLGNIPFADYIDGIPSISAFGLGDAYHTLEQYGMEHLELNESIATVLDTKISSNQNHLTWALSSLREKITEMKDIKPRQNPFLSEPNFLKDIITEPLLRHDMEEYQRLNPSLSESDIGLVNDLMKKHPNYFQIAVGKDPLLMITAQTQAFQSEYNRRLTINKITQYNEDHAGIKPKKNPCRHVNALVAVRKIRDDVERFKSLTVFFKLYQGTRDQNWIDCNQCNQHLLCMHERLQLQAYLHPSEKSMIEKDIILNFSGGQFQGKYICRNCGQPIRDLDFDNNMEFDDDGKPKSGRAVLVDEDAIFDEQIESMISVPIEPSRTNELQLAEGDQTACYHIVREIAMDLGISLENKEYRNIINRMMMWIGKFPQRDQYAVMQQGNPALLDYDIIYSRLLIASAATFLLIEIQTKIPSHVARFPMIGCSSPGFGGYPLDSDSEKRQGINYLACVCAVASLQRKNVPWNNVQFKTKNVEKRRDGIIQYMMGVLNDVQEHDMIQAQLAKKRKYIIAYPTDVIPSTFLPEQLKLTAEEAAANVIIPEVAENTGPQGKAALIKLWIRQAHILAKKNAHLARGSPLIETTCCMNPIETPGSFWNDLNRSIMLGKRTLIPNQQGNFLLTEFIPRDVGIAVAEPDPNLYYRLFLKYCFTGLRMGHPHEPGLTNKCPWCKFQFPSHPSVMDSAEAQASLSDVPTNSEQFIELLDTIHQVNEVEPISLHERSTLEAVMAQLEAVVPPPLSTWNTLLHQTMEKVRALPPGASRRDVIGAVGDISVTASQAEQAVKQSIIEEPNQQILNQIADLSWSDFFKVIQTYFIIPFQRIVSRYNKAALFLPHELIADLSDDHVTKALQPILNKEMEFMIANEIRINQPGTEYVRVRLADYLKRMCVLLPFKNSIRPPTSAQGEKSSEYKYIQSIFLYGPLSILFNRSYHPEGTKPPTSIASATSMAFDFLRKILIFSLNKYQSERLSYNDEELKVLIAIRNEKERTSVLAKFDKLNPEERRIEVIKKNLRMGQWAVGGTSLIYAYDADYWDLERQKRLDAGIVDFPGHANGEMLEPQGRERDDMGLLVMNDADVEDEGGYDVEEENDEN